MNFDDNKDKPSKCGREFDLKYRSGICEAAFSVDTNITVRVTACDAKEALTIVESSKLLSEKLKGTYLVSIT